MRDGKILLIDSNSLANRAYYAIPPLDNGSGLQTNAIYGFMNMLHKILADERPEYVCAVFDCRAKTFRHRMYPEYKGTRKPMPDDLAAQIPVLQELLTKLGIKTAFLEGYEADDIIGTLSKRFDNETIIVTGDRDSLQLVSDTVSVHLTKRGIADVAKYTPQALAAEGFAPEQIVEYKALAGDASDNIPGCPGVGDKTARRLLDAYVDVDGVYARLDELKDKLKERLIANKSVVELSKKLATIKIDVPLDCSLDDIRYEYRLDSDAIAYLRYLRFDAIYAKFAKISAVSIPPGADSPFPAPGSTAVVATDAPVASLAGIAEALNSLDPTVPTYIEIADDCAAFGDASHSYAIAFAPGELNKADAISALKPLLASKRRKAFFDVKAAMRAVAPYGIAVERPYDDMRLMSYLINSAYSIKSPADLLTFLGIYAQNAVCAMPMALDELNLRLDRLGLRKLYDEIELPLIEVLRDMEVTGFRVDSAVLDALDAQYSDELKTVVSDIYAFAGEEFNVNSNKRLAGILYDKLGLRPGRRTKSGYSVDADALEELDHPIVSSILRYRELTKLKSAYVDGMRPFISPSSGRVHTTFNQCVTVTGRLSSSDPNLQNIPIRRQSGREIRKMFVPSPGNVIVSADYSQIELRLMAHLSGDPKLISAFCANADIHRLTASKIFGAPLESVTDEMRASAKAINFGVIYGISAYGLAKNAGVSLLEAKAFMDNYYRTYADVKKYMDSNVEKAKADGFLRTVCGRIRRFPELKSPKYSVRAFGERAAMNMPLQGGASDIAKIAMIRVFDELKSRGLKSKLLLQVHDELILDCPISEVAEAARILKTQMESALELKVPLVANIAKGANWHDVQ